MRDTSADPWHALTCTANTARDKTVRHNDQVGILARHAKRAGAHAMPPPRLDSKSNKIPDLEIDMDDKQLLLDVVITNPLAPSNIANNTGAVRRAEMRKHARYDHMLATNRDGFILSSFAIDSFGGLGAEARKVVSMLSDYATQHSLDGLSSRQHKSDLRREISVSLHKHNARMTQRWLCNERRRGIHRQATSSAFAASAASSLGLAAHH